jgi:hypothetical protein
MFEIHRRFCAVFRVGHLQGRTVSVGVAGPAPIVPHLAGHIVVSHVNIDLTLGAFRVIT